MATLMKEKAGSSRSKEVCKNKWTKMKSDFIKWRDSQLKTGAAKKI
jgi:hypothetical protein